MQRTPEKVNKVWRVTIKHTRAVYRHRHHYYTAAGISISLLGFGMVDFHHHLFHWLYAVFETFVTGDDGHG